MTSDVINGSLLRVLKNVWRKVNLQVIKSKFERYQRKILYDQLPKLLTVETTSSLLHLPSLLQVLPPVQGNLFSYKFRTFTLY